MATKRPPKQAKLGIALHNQELTRLKADLQTLRSAPPLVQRSPGKYEGGILGFVKGLRLSAGVIHFLQTRLSHTNLEVSWGHLLNDKRASCSPECDVIVHSKGYVQQWNGSKKRIMLFKFVDVAQARAVISCKSQLDRIDRKYPKALKTFGVDTVFLFAECCKSSRFGSLRNKAKEAGYADLCCLYFTGPGGAFEEVNEELWVEFGEAVLNAVT